MKDTYLDSDKVVTQTKDRAQKIVAALYLLTEHIDMESPIRIEIRTNAVLLLKSVISGKNIDDIKASILSFLAVAVLTKQISHENASIIETELSNLKVQYVSTAEPVLSHIFIQEKDMALTETKQTKEFENNSFLRTESTGILETSKEVSQRDGIHNPKTRLLETKNNDNSQAKKDEKKARRLRVLEHLSKTELRTIKDVSKFFTDCSEKTIQRELNDLVEEKTIVRVGDRRWSTYKLA